MSKTNRAPGAKSKLAEDGDICPVCKSSRYLNPNMKFLVNPECYHKMCESCVDRIFSHGPAPCPIAGCKKTLRKARFRTQTFEDLKVEREVDIRRTVARVFDKQESDFESLLDYNDYLETVEEVSWNLILGIDVEATREKMRRYEEARKAELNPNAAVRRPDEPDTSTLSDKSHVVLKKGGKQKKMLSSSANAPNPATAVDDDAGFTFRGLKKPKAPEPEKPFDPFGGWSIEPQRYVLQNDYTGHLFFADILQKPWHYGGGYDMHEYYSHAMCDAFGGIGIFIEDEMAAKEAQGSGDAGFGTQMAAAAAATTVAGGRDVDMADIF